VELDRSNNVVLSFSYADGMALSLVDARKGTFTNPLNITSPAHQGLTLALFNSGMSLIY